MRFCQNRYFFRQEFPATCVSLRPPHGGGRRGKFCNFILLLCRKWLFETLISHKLLFNISVKLHKICRIDPNERLYFSIFSTLNGYGWTDVRSKSITTWKFRTFHLELSTMVGENFVCYLSQMAIIAFKLSNIIGENFECYLSQIAHWGVFAQVNV